MMYMSFDESVRSRRVDLKISSISNKVLLLAVLP